MGMGVLKLKQPSFTHSLFIDISETFRYELYFYMFGHCYDNISVTVNLKNY